MSFYSIKRINNNLYRIGSETMVYCDLIIGNKKALLFDTAYGIGNLKATIRKITNLPLIIVNSHGHVDHSCGNYQFNENIYIHKNDVSLCIKHTSEKMRKSMVKRMKKNINYMTGKETNILPDYFDEENYIKQNEGNLVPFSKEKTFDLGDVTIKTISLPGHTKGCIGLYYEEEKLLYTGDSISPMVWLFFEESTDIKTYINSIQKAISLKPNKLIMSHSPAIRNSNLLDYLLDFASNLDKADKVPYIAEVDNKKETVMYIKKGYSIEDINKKDFAAIVLKKKL